MSIECLKLALAFRLTIRNTQHALRSLSSLESLRGSRFFLLHEVSTFIRDVVFDYTGNGPIPRGGHAQ
jgi:hypothetical protein